MSLRWAMPEKRQDQFGRDCGDWKGKQWSMKPWCEAVIFATMSVDLGSITKKNVKEWLFRLKVLRKIDKLPMSELPTTERLLKMEGLSTNVITKSRSWWMNRVKKMLEQEILRYESNPRRKVRRGRKKSRRRKR